MLRLTTRLKGWNALIFCRSALVFFAVLAFRNLFPALLEQFRNQPSPASLMIRANPRAVISMEIFVKQNQVAPKRIALEIFQRSRNRPSPVFSADKNMPEPFRDFTGHLPQIRVLIRTRRAWHLKILAIIVVKFLQRFDEQIVDRHPNWSTPVRVASEYTRRRFRGFIVHA